MRLAIHTIQSTLYEGDAEKVICETPLGQMAVLDHHAPLITAIEGPEISLFEKNGAQKKIPITGGVMEIQPESKVVVLANG